MASRPKRGPRTAAEDSSRGSDNDRIDSIRRFIRREGKRYLKDPNITSIGIGHKSTGGKDTGELSVQFTVRVKGAEGTVPESLGTALIPEALQIDGQSIPTDVLERDYEPSYRKVVAEQTDPRKLRQDPMMPGVSIGHVGVTAGTFGMVVQDRRTSRACILSNWHVLHGGTGEVGDEIVQPGPADDNNTRGNVCGQLMRSHLGDAGDCAVAVVDGRGVDPKIFELGVVPDEVVEVELGDEVIKSGRTTAVTRGVVRRVDVMVDMDYDGVSATIGCFEIAPLPGAGAEFEVSKGGDSGSAWMIAEKGKATPKFAGLHFAGEATSSQDEHALACYAKSVFKKLNITLPSAKVAVETLSVGYDPQFLVDEIPVPKLRRSIAKDAFEFDGGILIPYTHFSVCLSTTRGFARFVAWNIDGASTRPLSRKGLRFKLDDRIPEEYQHGASLYRNNKFDQGHIARRADLVWGPPAEAQLANADSFRYTNITPQHEAFNQSGKAGLWGQLENAIFEDVDVENLRISVIGGPIFADDDPKYRGVQIPRQFFKVVAYHDSDAEETRVRAFELTQKDLLHDVELLELDPFNMYRVSLDKLSDDTRLNFTALEGYDTKTGPETLADGVEAGPAVRLIESREDLLF